MPRVRPLKEKKKKKKKDTHTHLHSVCTNIQEDHCNKWDLIFHLIIFTWKFQAQSTFHLRGFLSINSNILFFFSLFRAIPVANGSFQARGRIGYQLTTQPQQCQIWVSSETYTTVHGNAGSLTHCERPGIKPVSSGILVRLFSAALSNILFLILRIPVPL